MEVKKDHAANVHVISNSKSYQYMLLNYILVFLIMGVGVIQYRITSPILYIELRIIHQCVAD